MSRVIVRACVAALVLLAAAKGTSWAAEDNPAAAGPAAPPLPQIAPDTPPEQLGLRLSPLTEADLAAEAQAWQGLLKAKTQEVVELRIALQQATGEEANKLTEAIVALSGQRGALSSGLGEILQAWEMKGGNPEKIEPIRKYVSAAGAEQLRGARLETTLLEFQEWLLSSDGGVALGRRILVFLGALVVLWVAARMVARLVRRAMRRVNVSALLREFVARAAFWGVIAAGLLLVLATWGVHVGGLLALVGGASFVLAFAMQNTLSNFAAGLMIMVYRPFDVGDQVEVAGVAGRVEDVSIVSTTITTPDNRVVIIPNGSVWGSVITNATASDTRRVDLVFTIGREDDVERARRVLEEVLAEHPQVLKDPPPDVRLWEFGRDSVRFACEAWTKTANYWSVHGALLRRVKERLDAAGVASGELQRAAA